MHQTLRKSPLQSPTYEDTNLRGWESVAANWRNVSWPRRPAWNGEFQKLEPLLSTMSRGESLVLGATPEFRAWLHRAGSRVSLYEKSEISFIAMTRILADEFRITRPHEIIIPHDWESPDYERRRYHLIMGDLVTGYLETEERFMAFMLKLNRMLAEHGRLALREFVNLPYGGPLPFNKTDLKRWAYILSPDVAIEGNTFYEEKLAVGLTRVGERDVLSTCAYPLRTRLILPYEQFSRMFSKAGFRELASCPPDYANGPKPALWMLEKERDL